MFGPFVAEDGTALRPETTRTLEPGELLVFTAKSATPPAERPLAKTAATEAGAAPRLAL